MVHFCFSYTVWVHHSISRSLTKLIRLGKGEPASARKCTSMDGTSSSLPAFVCGTEKLIAHCMFLRCPMHQSLISAESLPIIDYKTKKYRSMVASIYGTENMP